MTTDDQIAVLTRMRELLSDPARVVLNPMNYYEYADGSLAPYVSRSAIEDPTCRMCMLGANNMVAWEMRRAWGDQTAELLGAKAEDLGIGDEEVFGRYSDGTIGLLTSALKAGRAVEVIDAVLADLQPVAA